MFLLLPAVLSAQTVQVSAGGIVSVGGVLPLYNGQYVMQKTDFGFLWLDSVALQGGYVGEDGGAYRLLARGGRVASFGSLLKRLINTPVAG